MHYEPHTEPLTSDPERAAKILEAMAELEKTERLKESTRSKFLEQPNMQDGEKEVTQAERIYMWFMFKLLDRYEPSDSTIERDVDEMTLMAQTLTKISIRRINELESL